MPRPLTRPINRRQELLKTTTIREFDGGWNVVDNDLNLSSRFAKVLRNMHRSLDGAIQVRWGTRLFAKVDDGDATTGNLTDKLSFTNASAVVNVELASHGLYTGHEVTLSGCSTTAGVPDTELNDTHVITVVDDDNFTITVSTPASSTVADTGGTISYSHNNETVTGDIVNMWYFQGYIIAVTSTGQITKIDGSGNKQVIWNSNIAGKLSGAPSAWGATTFASAAVFDGELIVCNGSDKPLLIEDPDSTYQPVQYLQDLASGSNANTPICRYVVAMPHYLVMAGDDANPGRVYISNYDTSGTWFGDAAPNDAVNVEVGRLSESQDNVIRGIERFRDRLLVAFSDNSVFGQFGLYDSATGAHEPDFSDAVAEHGCIAHNSMISLGNDLLMADNIGVPSISRALFTGSLRPDRASQLIDPDLQARLTALSLSTASDRVFAVYNKLEGQYMLFVPNDDSSPTETIGYVYTNVPALKIQAWSEFRGWNWQCGCRSELGRVFLTCADLTTCIYVYGSREDPIYADYVGAYDEYSWATTTAYSAGDRVRDSSTGDVYIALVDHTSAGGGTFDAERTTNPDLWAAYEGEAINFDWELPWADFDERMKTKTSKYLGLDAEGTADFTMQMFADKIYKDADTGDYLPVLSMDFVGGDSPGFGGGDQPFGGGRRTSDARLWAWTCKFQIAKLRVFGSTKKPLKIIALTIAYLNGSIRR